MSKTKSSLVVSDAPESIELTVYQGGPAVIRESRAITLDKGRSNLQLGGLPTQFVGGSLTVVSASGDGKFKMHSTSFREGNLSLETILARVVGSNVTLHEQTQDGIIEHSGKLIHILGRNVILQEDPNSEEVDIVPLTSRITLANGLPEGLTDQSSLVMDVSCDKPGDYAVDTLYESEGLVWRPWYEFFYDADAGLLRRLACFVELTNQSGTDMDDARLSLIAGVNVSVNQQHHHKARGMRMAVAQSASLEMAGGAGPEMDYEEADVETVGNQRMYTLPDSVTLENGETQNPALVFAVDVPVEQEYHLHSSWYGARRQVNDEDLPKQPVNVKLRLKNDKDSGLGVPLPPAQGRVLEPDSTGKLQKTDSTRVTGHIAKNERFSLDLGVPSKDLKATRELTFQHIDPVPEKKDDNFVDEGGLPDQPIARPMMTTAAPEVIDEGLHDRVRRGAVENAGKKKEEEKEPPRFQEEKRRIKLFNYGDEDATVFVHEDVPVNAEFISDETGFQRISEQSSAGVYEVTVPAGSEDDPGELTITYHIKWQIN